MQRFGIKVECQMKCVKHTHYMMSQGDTLVVVSFYLASLMWWCDTLEGTSRKVGSL